MEFGYADKTHFYSHETKVSLELAAGWEHEDEEDNVAIYYWDVDDADEDEDVPSVSPRVVIRAIAVDTTDPGAHIKVADAVMSADLTNVEVISRNEGNLDNVPAVYDTFTFDQNGTRVTQYMAHAQLADIVFSLIGVVEEAYTGDYLDDIKEGIASARFILLPA